MRKILAGFMATAMVTSICATASMAATNTSASADIAAIITNTTLDNVYSSVEMTIDPDTAVTGNEVVKTTSVSFTDNDGAGAKLTAIALAKALNGVKFNDIVIKGKVYTVTLNQIGNTAGLKAKFNPAVAIDGLDAANTIALRLSTDGGRTHSVVIDSTTTTITDGTGGETIDSEKAGDMTNVAVSDVVKCYGDGTPVPLTENGVGADKDLNDNGGVQSGNTVYFMIRDDETAAFDRLEDEDYWKLKASKGDNGKYVKAITDVTKIFSGDLYDANNGGVVAGTGKTRHRYLKVELNEIYTDDEYKIGLDLRLNATSKAVSTNIVTSDSTEVKVKDFKFWMKNIVKTADNDWRVGIGGLMLNPVQNDWNEVTYYDEDGDVAFMKFFGDSDVGKFYAKLSTKWAHEDYAAYFNDQDAFYFEFTGSPKLSSTSRADLQIYNPFVDEDGNETIDPSTATIYQVVDGDLIDVTESFTYGEAENGEDAFITRTRFLGSYIICEKPVEEATGDADIDDLMPDENEVPEEVTPDNNAGGKAPANTGRYA